MHNILRNFLSIALVIIIVNTAFANDKDKVAKSAEDICPILIGEKIPELILTDIDGKSFNLNNAIANKPTILVVYRGGWCPFCNLQLENLRKVEPNLISLGYQLIAISIDRPAKLKESLDKIKLNYTLLSDSNASASIALGIAFKVDDNTIELYKKYGINLGAASGKNHHILPVPSVFIIGKDQIIKYEYVNPNYKVRLNSDLLLSTAKFYIEELKKK
ncbi:MAG: AhpC/TSA family protein [Bacteroidetes bacterium]|nr:AhpC/TSA family protein [Bacteroidota bacterium]